MRIQSVGPGGFPGGEIASDIARPVIAVDGCESLEGRVLFAISALAYCARWLPLVDLRFTDVSDDNVVTAIDLLRFDYSVDVDIRHPNDRTSPLQGADLYVAAAFRSARHLRLDEARQAGIPTLLAIQFPDKEWAVSSVLLRQYSAFDPRAFAADLKTIVRPWF